MNGTRFLLHCKDLGVEFSRTAMIGRQGLHLDQPQLLKIFRSFGKPLNEQQSMSILPKRGAYAEGLFKLLGALEIDSFDHSSYESATHIHDMNVEIPRKFSNNYTCVLDGGSLEHIFNFPIAVKNCMEMVAIGGHFLSITPANNLFGHGFYQFSPELHFSLFTSENGFELVNVLVFEDLPFSKWYKVKSPASLHQRVVLTNRTPTYLLVIAKKVKQTPILQTPPQQSDYVFTWTNATASTEEGTRDIPQKKVSGSKSIMKSALSWTKCLISKVRYQPKFNPDFFTPFDPTHNENLELP